MGGGGYMRAWWFVLLFAFHVTRALALPNSPIFDLPNPDPHTKWPDKWYDMTAKLEGLRTERGPLSARPIPGPKTKLYVATDCKTRACLAGLGRIVCLQRTNDAGNAWENVLCSGTQFDITDYGAIGDGSVDDTAAIQAAANACNAAPRDGEVYAPAGTYKTTSTVTITNCRLVGEGMVNTVFAPTTALAGSVAMVLAAPSNGGNLRQGGAQDIQITGPSTPSLGLHPSSLVDCLRLDASMILERVRITGCDKGITTNAPSGHNTFTDVEQTQNYYDFYLAHQVDNTDGQADQFLGCNLSASYAIFGIPFNTTPGAIYGRGGTWGLVPYVAWQEGASPGTAGMLAGFHTEDVYFEGIGNAVMFSANNAINANGGAITNVRIINPGFSYGGAGFNLPSASCQAGTGNPYQCCTGSGTGCSKAYGINVGPIIGNFYEWAGVNPIDMSGAGGTGAIHSTNCTGSIVVDRQGSMGPIQCDAHPEYANVSDGHGSWNWTGNTPTDAPVPCTSLAKGRLYDDLSLNELCRCNGTNWCKVSNPSSCGSPSSCG